MDAMVSWDADPALPPVAPITNYLVTWTQNGTALPTVSVPSTSALDASGYTLDFTTSTGITPVGGDVIGATVQSVNSVGSSPAIPSVPPTITEPVIPPTPTMPTGPVSVTLVQT